MGVPQGRVPSCIRIALGVDECFSNIPHAIKFTLYVDDLTIYYSDRKTSKIVRNLQFAVNNLRNDVVK